MNVIDEKGVLILVPTRLELRPFVSSLGRFDLQRSTFHNRIEYVDTKHSLSILEIGVGREGVQPLEDYLRSRARPSGVILIGTAASIVSKHRVPEIVQARRIRHLDSDKSYTAKPLDWSGASSADFVTVDKPVWSVREKQRINKETMCHCLEMEGFHISALCSREELPFSMVRGISDDLRSFGFLRFLLSYSTVMRFLASDFRGSFMKRAPGG